MVLYEEVPHYSNWLQSALQQFGMTSLIVVLVAVVLGYIVSAFRYGPMQAGDVLYRSVLGAAIDLVRMSPRRVWALTRLAVQESMRRRVWIALVAFAVILTFAGWFLDPTSPAPGPLYLSFVLSWTTYLVLILALFMSAFSLPADVKNRTITTVVTKPVRSSEIVLGRILGFTLIGTVLLAVMGLGSYLFVIRSLSHTHAFTAEDLTVAGKKIAIGQTKSGIVGRTQIGQHHQHDVILNDDGTLETDIKHGHKHHVTMTEIDGKQQFAVGPHEDLLVARVPVRGKLKIIDRDGNLKEKGISVGKEWDYRGFIDGGTLAKAVWIFDGVDEKVLFGDRPEEDRGLPLEMTIRVFRTHKGKIEQGITSRLWLKNPSTQAESEPQIFPTKDAETNLRFFPRELAKMSAGENEPPIDLFKDLVHDGQLEVHLQCVEPGQYLGMAPPDLYIRAGNASFAMNFVKGYLSIWMQMVLVVSLGVMFSTFVSGPVAMVATLGCIVMGFFAESIAKLFRSLMENNRKLVPGGGPVESFIRLITQKSITAEYNDSAGIQIVYWIDKVALNVMKAFTDLLPDFTTFSNVNFVASGFNIPGDLVLEQATKMAAFVFATCLAGLIFFRMREVAQ
ncbi:MAG: ABC transporter permease [Pirellulales bacterium]|nr:ABC transporter permease [Pirellulales bacterium]